MKACRCGSLLTSASGLSSLLVRGRVLRNEIHRELRAKIAFWKTRVVSARESLRLSALIFEPRAGRGHPSPHASQLDVSGKGGYPKTISLFSSTRSTLQISSPDYRPYKPLKPLKRETIVQAYVRPACGLRPEHFLAGEEANDSAISESRHGWRASHQTGDEKHQGGGIC